MSPALLAVENPPVVRLRSVSYHPFIYRRMIDAADPAAAPGDLVVVQARDGQTIGHGLYNPRSQIAVRLLRTGDAPIDEAFWRQRIAAAVDLRRRTLRLDEHTDACRLIHAEGDGLSGLVAERFGGVIVFEVFSLGIYRRIDAIGRLLCEILGPPSPEAHADQWTIIVRADQRVEAIEGFHVPPPTDAPNRLIIRENGVRFRIDVAAGHKTGFFCDQRDNRRDFAAFCREESVLDLCCNTGGFGIYARVHGRARDVTGIDLDEAALDLARENANLNQVRIQQVHADAFPWLRQMAANARTWDAVVLDPPRLIASRGEARAGRQRYLDLNKLALQVVRPGGLLLTCSCSGLLSRDEFLDVVRQAGRITGRDLAVLNVTGAAPDHPVALNCPESGYLKAVWLRVL